MIKSFKVHDSTKSWKPDMPYHTIEKYTQPPPSGKTHQTANKLVMDLTYNIV